MATQPYVSNQRQPTLPGRLGTLVAYNSDYDGNEHGTLPRLTSNGQVVNLSNTPEVSEEGAAWSRTEKSWLTW